MRHLIATAPLVLFVAASIGGQADEQAAQKERLAKVQQLVGTWRGVGQPQRGSTKDSWSEEADWVWNFDKGGPQLVAKSPQGRHFQAYRISAGQAEGQYVLVASTPANGDVRYEGQLDEQGQLIFMAKDAAADVPVRLSFRFVAGGDRLLVLLERKGAAGGPLARVAEIGYTRQGSGFGKNVAQRECVVTGGLGTIEVSYEGKTYYVCCTGCRDYFNEDPKKVLAEYVARKAEEKKK